MYIMYVDMSGTVGDATQTNFVMAGVAVHEAGLYHVIKELDDINSKSKLKIPDELELHGNEILRGKKFWRKITPRDRIQFFKKCLSVLTGKSRHRVRCFGAIMDKGQIGTDDPVEHGFEQLSSRFNAYLRRQHLRGNTHKGLIVCDESRYEQTLQNLAAEYRVNGTRWGHLRNMAEIPLFADSKASRLIQLADLISYSMWQRFERNEPQYFAEFVSSIDYDGGIVHGLYHRRAPDENCQCPGCLTRNWKPVKRPKPKAKQKSKAKS